MRTPAMMLNAAATLWGCAGTNAGQVPPGEEILARGGTLDATTLPNRPVEVYPDRLVAWGITEVPANSRLQMAKAGVDAITRAELLKYLDVTVASAMEDLMRSGPDGDEQRIRLAVAEAVRGALPGGPLIQHGWARLVRPEGAILRVVGRLEVDREFLSRIVSDAPEVGDVAKRVMDGVFSRGTP